MVASRTYANITKYLRMATSSNFGNMLSMAAATLLLPFLPMLPVQTLLNNPSIRRATCDSAEFDGRHERAFDSRPDRR